MGDPEAVFWSIAALHEAYREGSLSPVEVAQSVLERIEAFDGELHSYLSLSREGAVAQARESEERFRRGEDFGSLDGIPISIKDLFDVKGMATTLGSRLYGHESAKVDSFPVARLRDAGAVFLGKTNTAEFGQSATTDNLLAPDCANPWDTIRTSGGSSGGAAASVGAGLATAALGSDGGGSIRIPAAMCGLFGLKPTYRSLPLDEAFKAMSSFVCAGPITRTVDDARRMYAAQVGAAVPSTLRGRRCRIAWSPSPQGHAVDPTVRAATAAAVQRLVDLGHSVEEVDLPIDGWEQAFAPLVLRDEHHYRAHLLQWSDDLTYYARSAIEHGSKIADADVARAREAQANFTARLDKLFLSYDFLVLPTMACLPFPHEQRPTVIDGVKVHPLWGPFPFTAAFNVAGTPAASLPVELANGLPVGLQVVGANHSEAKLLDFCEDLEETLPTTLDIMRERWALSSSAAVIRG